MQTGDMRFALPRWTAPWAQLLSRLMTRLSHPRVHGATHYLSKMPVSGDHKLTAPRLESDPELFRQSVVAQQPQVAGQCGGRRLTILLTNPANEFDEGGRRFGPQRPLRRVRIIALSVCLSVFLCLSVVFSVVSCLVPGLFSFATLSSLQSLPLPSPLFAEQHVQATLSECLHWQPRKGFANSQQAQALTGRRLLGHPGHGPRHRKGQTAARNGTQHKAARASACGGPGFGRRICRGRSWASTGSRRPGQAKTRRSSRGTFSPTHFRLRSRSNKKNS